MKIGSAAWPAVSPRRAPFSKAASKPSPKPNPWSILPSPVAPPLPGRRWLSVNIKAPILDPRKIFALAGNYREHIREGGGEVVPKEQQVPQVFVKPVTTIIGLNDEIRLPGPICTSVDYEGELGIVIGRRCHYVDAAEALDYVAGYINFNDVSGRKLNISAERKPMPRTPFFDWLNGKWFDTFAPTGPFLVLKDEIEDPHALDLELRVNGEVRQTASTGDMIFSRRRDGRLGQPVCYAGPRRYHRHRNALGRRCRREIVSEARRCR